MAFHTQRAFGRCGPTRTKQHGHTKSKWFLLLIEGGVPLMDRRHLSLGARVWPCIGG